MFKGELKDEGFDLDECFIRVYVDEKSSVALQKAFDDAVKVQADYLEGVGPKLDLKKFGLEDVKCYIIDGLHRCTALKELALMFPDLAARYSKVTAVFYTADVKPMLTILSKTANKLSQTHVAEDALGKLTFYAALAEDFRSEQEAAIASGSKAMSKKKSQAADIVVWFYHKLGKAGQLNKKPADQPKDKQFTSAMMGRRVHAFNSTNQVLVLFFWFPYLLLVVVKLARRWLSLQ